MGNATGRELHIDRALSQMAIDYRPTGFIADMIFPVVDVQNRSDKYNVFSRADKLRREDTRRSPGRAANRITQTVGSGTFYAENYALASPVTIEDKANADPMLIQKLINGRAEYIMDKLMLDYEYRIAAQVTNTSNVGSSAAVSSAWNGAGDVLGTLNQAIDNLVDANAIADQENIRVVMGAEAWRSARRDATVRNLIFGANNGGGYPSIEQMKDLLDVGDLMVGGAFENTGEEGIDTETLSRIWGDDVLIYYAPKNASTEKPSYGYSYRWNVPGVPTFAAERHPYNSVEKTELVEIGYYQDEKITGQTYSYLLTSVNSST
jgi:hypothetical protein